MGSSTINIGGSPLGGGLLALGSGLPSASPGLSTNAQGVIGGLGAGVLGALGNAFGTPSAGKTTTDQTQTSTPTYSTAVLPLYNQLLSSYMQRANGGAGNAAVDSMINTGQQTINQTNQGGVNSLNTILAQRGQQYSPSGTSALVQQELARQSQQTGLINQAPVLRYQANTSDLSNAGNFFNSLAHGTSGTSNSTQTTQAPQQSWISSLLGGVANALPSALKMF